jgi:L-fuconolactonase
MRIDAHQHFWNYDPVRDSWISEEMSVIRKDFLPNDLKKILKQNRIDGCVAVQADQSEKETRFLVKLAEENDFIQGVVGWIDLCNENIRGQLENYQNFNLLKGFRHILQGEKDRAFMLREDFMRGISALRDFNYSYDILIFPDQLKYTREFISNFPDQKFVIDHIAKPNIKDRKIEEWRAGITELANFPNLFCKISGMVTEADWQNWEEEDFIPYLNVIVENFGIDRIIFGSDWPVCLLGGSYDEVLSIAEDYFSSFSKSEQEKFFGMNAVEFYNLK